MRVTQQVISGSRKGDFPLLEEISLASHLQDSAYMLSRQKQGNPVATDLFQGVAEPVYVLGDQAQKRKYEITF